MRHAMLFLILAAGVVAMGPVLAEPEQAEHAAAASGRGDGPAAEKPAADVLKTLNGVLGVALVALGGLVLLVARTALSLAALALWPLGTARSAEWIRQRPWLCFGWGVPILIVSIVIISVGNEAQGLGSLVGMLTLGALLLAVGFGSAALCEVFGEMVLRLRDPLGQPSRFTCAWVGGLVGVVALLTPPGWVVIPFAVPCAVGAARFLFAEPPRGTVNLGEATEPALDV